MPSVTDNLIDILRGETKACEVNCYSLRVSDAAHEISKQGKKSLDHKHEAA